MTEQNRDDPFTADEPSATTDPAYEASEGTYAQSAGTYATTAGSSGESSTTETAKDEAGHVAQTAKDSGAQVAGTAREEGQRVLSEATDQARNLVEETRTQLSEQASSQQQRAASSLHSLADELRQMASNSDQEGVAAQLVRQASERVDSIAGWLDQRDPQALLDDARDFARRRPGAFLAGAAIAGMLAGRATRAGVDVKRSEGSDQTGFAEAGYPGTTTTYPTDYGVGTAGAGATGGYTGADYPSSTGTAYPTETGTSTTEPAGVAPLVPPAPEDPSDPYAGTSRTGDPLSDRDERL